MSASPAGRIAFEPMRADHLELFAGWLEAPHVREWWGEPAEERAKVRDMIEGRDTTRPYLIRLEGRAIGYIQVWYLGHHQNETWLRDHPWLSAFPADAVGVDLAIGEKDLISRNIGSSALRQFVEMLLAEGCSTIIIDPDPDNGRAVRAYEKAGFRPVSALEGKTEGVLIMQFHPNEATGSP